MAAELLKRRILYIRHPRTHALAEGFRANQDEWTETLSDLSDIHLVTSDFDMHAVCDRLQPHFIVYESPFLQAASINIANPLAHPDIPRFAFQMQDSYCATRVQYLRRIEELGIHWIFTHMADMLFRLSPEMKSRAFSLPHLFDERVFRDYGLSKDIPVSIFGAHLMPDLYNWRANIVGDITQYFPALIYTHPGYHAPVPRHKFQVTGTDYAKLLNRSYFSLADTTHFDCFLRKHLEIPAAGSVLVAPDAPCLKPYGFRDMENCILGSGKPLYDKMAAVADNPDAYDKIRKAGHDLVHARYSRKQWRGMLDFYELLRTLKPGETIRQPQLLGPFEVMPESDAPPVATIQQYPDNASSTLAGLWLDYLRTGENFAAIEEMTKQRVGWMSHVTEQWIPMGIACLLRGDAQKAIEFLRLPQKDRVEKSGIEDYDPEEIAWLSLAASLAGDTDLLNVTRRYSVGLRHLSLRRMQYLPRLLSGENLAPADDLLRRQPQDHLSIHWTGQLPFEDWLSIASRILTAFGQKPLVITPVL